MKDAGRGLDVLAKNAGMGYAVLDIDVAEAQRLCDVNLWGPLQMIHAFSDMLIASLGCVVNVSSSAAIINSLCICESLEWHIRGQACRAR